VVTGLREQRVLVLPCGARSVRFRPALSVTDDELRTGIAALERVLTSLPATTTT
jgi:L-lysine 6-transaminase